MARGHLPAARLGKERGRHGGAQSRPVPQCSNVRQAEHSPAVSRHNRWTCEQRSRQMSSRSSRAAAHPTQQYLPAHLQCPLTAHSACTTCRVRILQPESDPSPAGISQQPGLAKSEAGLEDCRCPEWACVPSQRPQIRRTLPCSGQAHQVDAQAMSASDERQLKPSRSSSNENITCATICSACSLLAQRILLAPARQGEGVQISRVRLYPMQFLERQGTLVQ